MEWKPINDYENYLVNKNGDVKGPRGNMKVRANSRGYIIVGLRKRGERQKMFSVHRLVAEHFLVNEENKPQVNHKDGDKTNNNVNNLEWVTQRENQIHAYKIGLQSPDLERLRGYAKKKERKVKVTTPCGKTEICESVYKASLLIGCSYSSVFNLLNGMKSRKGYRVEVV